MTRSIHFFVAACTLYSACSAAVLPNVRTDVQYLTQANLRLDARGQITTLNYSDWQVLPVCTPVRILHATTRTLQLATHDGRMLRFVKHRSSQVPMEREIARLFQPTCPDVTRLDETDQAGIRGGQVLAGMSKSGVLVALGYPPAHRTPDLRFDVWTYWSRTAGQYRVHFEGDRAVGIQGGGAQGRGVSGPTDAERAQPYREISAPGPVDLSVVARALMIEGVSVEQGDASTGVLATPFEDTGLFAIDLDGVDATMHRRYTVVVSADKVLVRLDIRRCALGQTVVVGNAFMVGPACQAETIPVPRRRLRGTYRELIEHLEKVTARIQSELAATPAASAASDPIVL